MLKRALLIAVFGPLGLLMVILAVANRHKVTFSFDPLGGNDPALSVEAPLFLLLFAFLILGTIAGGVAAWINQAKWRRTARAKRGEAARWKHEAREMQRQAEHATHQALPAPGQSRDAA